MTIHHSLAVNKSIIIALKNSFMDTILNAFLILVFTDTTQHYRKLAQKDYNFL